MEFFIASNGQKTGPFSIYRITDMVRDKDLTAKDLAWTKDQGEWQPLGEIEAFESVFRNMRTAEREDRLGPSVTLEDIEKQADAKAAIRAEGKVQVVREVQPFARFWARWIDYMIVFTLVYAYSETPQPPSADVSPWEIWAIQKEWMQSEAGIKLAISMYIGLIVWHLLEGIVLSVFGTTPGKAFFGIRVTRQNGKKISVLEGVGRSGYIFGAGIGLGIWILPLVGMAFGFFRLMSTGKTPWDAHLKLRTQHTPMSFVRILVAIGAFLVLMMALQLLNTPS